MKLSNLIAIAIIIAIGFALGTMRGYSCGKNEEMGKTQLVYRHVDFPKTQPIDSLGIFERFRKRLRIPKIRYVDVIKEAGVIPAVTDTLTRYYGFLFGMLGQWKRGNVVTYQWYTIKHDTLTDSTTTRVGKDTLVTLKNPRSNYDILPSGDSLAPFVLYEYPFSRMFAKEFNLGGGSGLNKAEMFGNAEILFFDKFFSKIEARIKYKYKIEFNESPFEAEVMVLGGIRF